MGDVNIKWFRNLKLSVKLITGFFLVAIIAGIVGIVGIVNLVKIGEADENLYHNNTMGISYASTAEIYYQRIRFYSNRMFLVDGEERRQAYDKIYEYFDLNEELFDLYKVGIDTEEDQILYDNMLSLWGEYKTLAQQAVEHMQAGKFDEAKAIVFGKIAIVGGELQNAFSAITDYNKVEGGLTEEKNMHLVLQATKDYSDRRCNRPKDRMTEGVTDRG